MNGRVVPAMMTAVVGSNMLHTGSQKRKRGLATMKKLAEPEVIRAPPTNGFASNYMEVDEAKALMCILCADKKHELVELRKHPEIKRILMSFAELPPQSCEGVNALVCVQCILKVNMQQDMRRQMKDKIKRMINGQSKRLVTSTPNHISAKKSLSSFPKKSKRNKQASSPSPTNICFGEKVMDISGLTTLPASNVSPRNCLPTSTENTEELLSQSQQRVTIERSISPPLHFSSPLQRRYSNEAMTLPDSATKSPPSATCRVGTIHEVEERVEFHQHTRSKSSLLVPNGKFCTRISRFSSHLRSISPNAQNHSMLDVVFERKESALITESGGKINQYAKVDEVYTVQRTTQQQYVCKTCQRIYQRKHFYSKHVRRCRARPLSDARSLASKSIRMSTTETENKSMIFHCSTCPVTVDSMAKLRKHKRIHLTRFYCPTCGQEFNALQDYEYHCIECLAKQVSKEQRSSVVHAIERRVTRSRSRAASMAATHIEHKRKSINVSHQIIDSELEEAKIENSNAVDDGDYDDDDDDIDEQSDASVADTMYTKRMHYCDNWLQEHNNGTIENDSLIDNFNDYEEYADITTDKEYDLYLLDRLKMEITLGSLSCYVPRCDFRGNSVPHLMLHEFCDHLQRLMFHCKKCGESFTRKVHLDFHLYCQNGGRYICYKCGDVFEFQDQLDRHLIRHTKVINYCCSYCNFEFLTKAELLEHCEIEKHDPNGERELISIVRSMTIENPVPPPKPAEKDKKRQYKVHLMEMHLPRLPYNPQISKPFKHPKAGDLRFKGQLHPNCCSCVLYVKDFDRR